MRCPKCKFISFDDLSNCAKCAHNLSALSAELNGTCIETHLEFFLGSVIQAPNFEENEFSDSQTLPPIDHDEIDFDDTGSGGFSALKQHDDQTQAINFDDSVGAFQEDDVSIELGDIMPIDLDQLDVASDMSDDTSDTLSFGSDKTGKFVGTNLDLELNEDFSDIDLDDDTSLDIGNERPVTHSTSSGADDTIFSVENEYISTGGVVDRELDLDDELIAELADSTDDLDATATLTNAASGFDTVNLATSGNFSEPSIEDLTGEFPPLDEGEEPELSSLDFSDIDVSDLVSSQGAAPPGMTGDDTLLEGSSVDEGFVELGENDLSSIDTGSLDEEDTEEPPELPS